MIWIWNGTHIHSTFSLFQKLVWLKKLTWSWKLFIGLVLPTFFSIQHWNWNYVTVSRWERSMTMRMRKIYTPRIFNGFLYKRNRNKKVTETIAKFLKKMTVNSNSQHNYQFNLRKHTTWNQIFVLRQKSFLLLKSHQSNQSFFCYWILNGGKHCSWCNVQTFWMDSLYSVPFILIFHFQLLPIGKRPFLIYNVQAVL